MTIIVDTEDRLDALRGIRARNDEVLAAAWASLRARGEAPMAVPREALVAIDAACLVQVSTLNPTAIRG